MRYFSLKLCGIHLSALALVVACIYLSSWQWNRAHIPSLTKPSNQAAPLNDLSPLRDYLPVKSIGRKVVSTGSFVLNSQHVYWQRPIDGKDLLDTSAIADDSGWLVAIFTCQDGSEIGVVLGATTNRNLRMDLSSIDSVTGFLQPSEDSPNLGIAALADSAIPRLTLSSLRNLNRASGTLHDGYLVLEQSPFAQIRTVKPIFTESIHEGLHWRNVIYTFNWIFFALIITAMWWRIIRDEVQSAISVSNAAD